METRSTEEIREWLRQQPPLAELRSAYPAEWESVKRELADLDARGDVGALKAYLMAPASAPASARGYARERAVLTAQVRRQMAAAAVRQLGLSAATGVTEGKVRFNVVNGTIAQRLLFARGLERKPVSLAWFRLLWPVVWQRKRLMPLVEPKGIYCFYSRALIRTLAEMIGSRRCLEIAAGDGTLARFLADAGADVIATDDHSWKHSIDFPDDVLRQDAKEALRRHAPEVVVCSWPPADNPFEAQVFQTPSVQLYVVIASSHEVGTGNWEAYRAQTDFEMSEDKDLGRLVLPPELESAVYVFRRRVPS
jgi:hypothetical protein